MAWAPRTGDVKGRVVAIHQGLGGKVGRGCSVGHQRHEVGNGSSGDRHQVHALPNALGEGVRLQNERRGHQRDDY